MITKVQEYLIAESFFIIFVISCPAALCESAQTLMHCHTAYSKVVPTTRKLHQVAFKDIGYP